MVPALTPSPLLIRCIRVTAEGIEIHAAGVETSGRCPDCGTPSTTIHGRYQRRPRDLPWRGYTVWLCVTVRRFRWLHPSCPRRTLAEDIGSILPKGSRRSAAATALLHELAMAVGGEVGAWLAHAIGLPTSPDTLLRLICNAPPPPLVTPRVLGVDDLALGRSCHYATLLVGHLRWRLP